MAKETKWTPDIGRKILGIVSERANISLACKVVGISTVTFYSWLRDSARAAEVGDLKSRYRIEWLKSEENEKEIAYFSDWLAVAKRMHSITQDQYGRSLLQPRFEPILDASGHQVWKEDGMMLAFYNGDREAALEAGELDPFYVHDAKGSRVPMTRQIDPPAALRSHILKSVAPQTFNQPDQKIVQTEITHINTPAGVGKQQQIRPRNALMDDLQARLQAKVNKLNGNPAALPSPETLARIAMEARQTDPPDDGGNDAPTDRPAVPLTRRFDPHAVAPGGVKVR